jgi:hypothetical protein
MLEEVEEVFNLLRIMVVQVELEAVELDLLDLQEVQQELLTEVVAEVELVLQEQMVKQVALV